VFPCWDEPAIKASVALTLITRADSTCISTMPAAAETSCASDGDKLSELMTGLTVNEWKTTRFTTTPPVCHVFSMSPTRSYGFQMSMNTPAWATGTLAHVERISPSKESVTLRIYGAPGSLANLDFALDVLAKV
jgi:aminopeptidase 2